MTHFAPLYSARLHGVRRTLEDRAELAMRSASVAADERAGAALRGKVRAYYEAIDLIDAVQTGRRLGRRLRWTDRRRRATA